MAEVGCGGGNLSNGNSGKRGWNVVLSVYCTCSGSGNGESGG
nr:hypothetical protein [uncultured Emticicia sp.]